MTNTDIKFTPLERKAKVYMTLIGWNWRGIRYQQGGVSILSFTRAGKQQDVRVENAKPRASKHRR